jgi:penicillin-binding protein-related factor A (putative recombinase)
MPKRKCKIGIKPKQAAWLEQWNNFGGLGVVIVGFGDCEKICILHKDFVKVLSEGMEVGEIELIEMNSVEEKIREIKNGRKN